MLKRQQVKQKENSTLKPCDAVICNSRHSIHVYAGETIIFNTGATVLEIFDKSRQEQFTMRRPAVKTKAIKTAAQIHIQALLFSSLTLAPGERQTELLDPRGPGMVMPMTIYKGNEVHHHAWPCTQV